MAEEQKFEKERWTYAGRRVAAGGKKLCYEYHDTAGNELVYMKPLGLGTVIGGHYEVLVNRHDGKTTAKAKASYLGTNEEDGKLVNQWRLLDQASSLEVQQRSMEAKLSGAKLEAMTLSEIKMALRRMPAFRRRALAATVLDILIGGAL